MVSLSVIYNSIPENQQSAYSEVLRATNEELRKFAEQLNELCSRLTLCAVGSQNMLNTCKDLLEQEEL